MSNDRHYPDFLFLASAGLIKGVSPLFKFGENPDIDTASVPEDINSLGGIKLFPTAASTISLVSDSAQDAVSGTGLSSVNVIGLDANYDALEEVVTMTGATPVVTTGEFLRVNALEGLLAGSDQRATGNIIATHSEGNIGEILLNHGHSLDVSYTVPAGHKLMIDRLKASLERTAAGAGAEIHFEIKVFGTNTWKEVATVSISAAGSSFVERDTDLWLPIAAKTDVRMHVSQVATNNTAISAAYDGLLVNLDEFAW
jgi:hypothetical protein